MNAISKWLTALALFLGSVIPAAPVTYNFTRSVYAFGNTTSAKFPLTPTVPAAASAVGYKTLTFNTTTLGSTPGTWQPFTFYGKTQPANYAQQNSDGSILLNVNSQATGGATIATAIQLHAGNRWSGVAFGGGFLARAVLSFTGQTNTTGYATGHPVFWALDVEHTSQGPYACDWPVPKNTTPWNASATYTLGQYVSSGGNYYVCMVATSLNQPPASSPSSWLLSGLYSDFFEVDFMEYDVNQFAYQNGIGNWYGNPTTALAIGGSLYQAIPGSNGSILVPNNTDFSQPHTYDCLWVPATATTQGYLKFYFDGTQTPVTLTWNQTSPTQLPPPVFGSTYMNGMDQRHMFLMLGSGPNYPMTVHSVQVWQASAASNIKK